MINSRFVSEVRAYQTKHQLSLRKTADVIQLSPSQLCRLYQGLHAPSVITILRTAIGINVPCDKLMP